MWHLDFQEYLVLLYLVGKDDVKNNNGHENVVRKSENWTFAVGGNDRILNEEDFEKLPQQCIVAQIQKL